MNRSEHLKAYGWTAAGSGIIGLFVGMTALLIVFYHPVMIPVLGKSILAGVIIGVVCRSICWFLVNRNYNLIFLWILVLGFVGVSTVITAAFIGKMSVGKVAILVGVAEIFGMVMFYGNYRHSVHINQKLRLKQEQLREALLGRDQP